MISLSPSVEVREFDLTTSIPQIPTSICGVVIKASWGPAFYKKLTSNERQLRDYWGYPSGIYSIDWFTANSFLYYGSQLWIVRAVDAEVAKNSVLAVYTADIRLLTVENVTGGPFVLDELLTGGTSTGTGTIKEIVTVDEVFLVEMTEASEEFEVAETVTGGTSSATADVVSVDSTPYIIPVDTEYIPNEDNIPTINFGVGEKLRFFAKYPGILGNTKIKVAVANPTDFATLDIMTGVSFVSQFEYAPTGDQIAVAVVVSSEEMNDDIITETWIVSLEPTEKDDLGKSIYIEEVINRNSVWLYCFCNISADKSVEGFIMQNMALGVDGAPAVGDITAGYDLFNNPEEFDVNILLDGANNDDVTHDYIITICENRMDCIAIIAALSVDVFAADVATAINNIITYKTTTLNRNSSYGALYANWKQVYDQYNDTYIWIPISGDAAGILALTDEQRDSWWAPAGLDRGQMKNTRRLAIVPNKSERDMLYKAGINPAVAFPNLGRVIWGQKTMLSKPSRFDRINVRRLFIFLEKAISTAAKYFIFEFNDEHTRSLFVLMVSPFLRNIQARRGLADFRVVCDESNNTPEVLDRNEFIGDIYIKPTIVGEFIQLNFIATKSGVNFDEIIRREG